jgi:hypothetical protein
LEEDEDHTLIVEAIDDTREVGLKRRYEIYDLETVQRFREEFEKTFPQYDVCIAINGSALQNPHILEVVKWSKVFAALSPKDKATVITILGKSDPST